MAACREARWLRQQSVGPGPLAGCRGISQVETDGGRTVNPSETQRSKVASVPAPRPASVHYTISSTLAFRSENSPRCLPCPLPSDPIRCSLIQGNVSCIPKLETEPFSFPKSPSIFFLASQVRKSSYLECPYVCLTPSWSEICFR